ncbi:MAG: LysR substrate-binding domain-containing protein [Aquamicrobium sp.]|uniref:LysR substrate-binding domain-containing protein n=1 Tax=Aquamicrobium sp. TaxID=1872579 RepID=UPI00349E51C5|nr:LysR substrate-binding domain-containing protein [Aquamicrobium sp.]
MDIRQLRYFLAIAEQGSFSRAAAQLHVAQPALSLHVRNMETDLKVQLLHRSPKGVVPTEAGAILLRNARIILDQLAVAEEEIRGHESDPAGEVRLGLPGTVSEVLSVPLITATHQRYPKIKIRIAEAMSGFVLEWMREARIDLAILYRDVNDHGIETVRLLEEELCFLGQAVDADEPDLPPPGEALAFAQAARLPLILPGPSHGLRELLARQALTVDIKLNTVIDIDSYGNIKELVRDGFGYSILPANAIAREVQAGELRRWPIASPAVRRAVHLAYSVERPMTNAVTAIQALACEVLRDLARTGRWAGAQACPLPGGNDDA